MDLVPELVARRARRGLSEEALPGETVTRLLEAATLAPSCFNNQPWRIIAVQGAVLEELRGALTEGNRWARRAPLIAVFCTKPSLDCRLEGGRDYAAFDLGMAALAFMLQATREALIAHPIAGYAPAKVAKILAIPEDYVVTTLVIVGRPGDEALLAEWQLERERGERQRRPLGEVAFRDSFGEAWPG
jgi:nitroreductase